MQEVDGSAYRDLPGLVWAWRLGVGMIGNFPVGGRPLHFLPSWHWITLDRFDLEVVRQGYSLPFVGMTPTLSRTPVKMPLPMLQFKRVALWEEVASLFTCLKKDAMETVQLLQDQAGSIRITSWLPSALVGSAPF